MPTPKYTVSSAGPRIREFLDRVLAAGGLRVHYEILDGDDTAAYFEKPQLVVKFSGPDVEYLTANKGEAVLALEQLTQEALHMPGDEHALICFDANDFRLLRMEELRLSALTVAGKVKETSTPYRFMPMNSRERRIVHLALREETTLRTESAGVAPHRHVVVYPAGMASLPEPPPPPPMRPSFGRGGDRGGRGGDRGGRGGDRGGRGGDRGPRRGPRR